MTDLKLDVKEIVRQKYGQIARQGNDTSGCCGCGGEDKIDYSVFNDDYKGQKGYLSDADYNLGCGLPTEYAGLKPGDAVLDLGSGAGNDCFVARAEVGSQGMVTGLDFTDEMLTKAEENRKKLGFENMQFVKGDIEEMPFDADRFDVVISNCVLNLVPDKEKAFSEIYRVLKQGGHFSISDVVLEGELPEQLLKDAEMYAGCVSGALPKETYMKIIDDTGFRNVEIKKEKVVYLPDSILKNYMTTEEIAQFRKEGTGILSITVSGKKQAG